ncbi:MAG: DnaJ domain-containing protein [Myxococcota bacterium]
MTCWKCHEAASAAVCVGCGAVQPPPAEADPYAILGLPKRFHVDLALVEERYKALARQVHPDKFAARPAVERRMALQWTAALNEARRVLKDDTRRAWWLATGQATPKEKGPKLDPSFLAEVFEWREAEEERPGAFAELAKERAASLRAELDAIFTAWEEGRGGLADVEDRLSRLKYVEAS